MRKRRQIGPRHIAAYKSSDRPHDDWNGDNDAGENDHALQDRRVKPDILVIVIVVIAYQMRPQFSQRTGWSTELRTRFSGRFVFPGRSCPYGCAVFAPFLPFYAAAFFIFAATFAAK